MNRIDKTIYSKRNTEIPITIIEANNPSKLLICVHGFKANRTEDNRFVEVAQGLSEEGVSSIMMGLPGCDESKEDFYYYTLQNCIDDIEVCQKYMIDNYNVGKDNLMMIGYSMGARLVCIYSKYHKEVDCLALWAGATFEKFGDSDNFLGVDLKQMEKEANEKGYCNFYNSFDDEYIKMNKEFIDQMNNISIEECLNNYKGNINVIHGDKDVIVDLAVARKTYNELIHANNRILTIIDTADHGFGGWNSQTKLSKQLVDITIEYFKEYIKEQ